MTLSDVRRAQAHSIRPDAYDLLGADAAKLLENHYQLSADFVRPATASVSAAGTAFDGTERADTELHTDVAAAMSPRITPAAELLQTPTTLGREYFNLQCLKYMPDVRTSDVVIIDERRYNVVSPGAEQETGMSRFLVYLIP